MIDIKAVGPMGSDATYPYKVLMDKPYTVREFVDEVASEKPNCGVIRYTTNTSDRFGKSLCNYRHGELLGEIDDSIAHRQVTEAWGSGGWTRYDFTLLV